MPERNAGDAPALVGSTQRERPVLFSGPMVKALLAGTKTQTRRIVKPQPAHSCRWEINGARSHALHLGTAPDGSMLCVPYKATSADYRLPCPYGAPGDRLWTRETFAFSGNEDGHPINAARELCAERDAEIFYRADTTPAPYGLERLPNGRGDYDGNWRPSIFLPRWASRVTLELTEVRVERVQAITEADCVAEGITLYVSPCDERCKHEPKAGKGHALLRLTGAHPPIEYAPFNVKGGAKTATVADYYRAEYASLFDQINGKGSWAANPWVWVVSFRKVA